jgi:hypothetical protein
MGKLSGGVPTVRKLIDLPISIIKDLKMLALESDKSLKSYLQELIISEVEKFRARPGNKLS